MRHLKFSEILGDAFYRIRLSSADADLVDQYFQGAAHHFWRYREADVNCDAEQFHLRLHRAHLVQLMKIVYQRGDFGQAVDPTPLGLNRRAAWNPDCVSLPDEEMFNEMWADGRYELGAGHPCDLYLKKTIDPSCDIVARYGQRKDMRLRVCS